MRNPTHALLIGLLLPVTSAVAQTAADPGLVAAIREIRAIDNHSHAMPARVPGAAESERAEPLGKTMFPYPVRLRVDNPEYIEAWRAMYGYEHEDLTDDHAREALRAKLGLMERHGTGYPSWILDRAGIETMLVNAPSLGPGQTAPRFLWVPTADGFLFPFGSDVESIRNLRKQIRLDAPPATLDEYLGRVVKPLLQEWKAQGAVAIKFVIAYYRSLDLAEVPAGVAEAIYARHAPAGAAAVAPADLKPLQDFLFRAVAREAGRVGLVVHLHTGVGADPYFHLAGSNPLLLESVFNDASLRHTSFVIVHGSWPFERETGVMVLKPNVYADFSAQPFLRSTPALSETLEEWLDFFPEKVLFGTDAYSEDTPLANWEEKAWLGTRTSRQALALALTRMMADGRISRSRAEELARMILRDNAAKLYALETR